MDNKQYRKILVSFIMAIILLGVVIFLLISILNKPRDVQVNNYIGQNGKNGIDGKSAYTPIKGVDYFDGVNAVSTNTIIEKQVVQTINQITNVPVKGDNGEKGDTGSTSPRLLMKVDYATCKLKTKYDGDDTWQTIAQLPFPCEVGNAK